MLARTFNVRIQVATAEVLRQGFKRSCFRHFVSDDRSFLETDKNRFGGVAMGMLTSLACPAFHDNKNCVAQKRPISHFTE